MTAKGCFVLVVWSVVCVLVVKDVICEKVIDGCTGGDFNNCIGAAGLSTKDDDLHVVALHTPVPVSKPKSLNMLVEEHEEANFRPTPLPLTTIISNTSSVTKNDTIVTTTTTTTTPEEPRGRALNFTLHDLPNQANSSHHQHNDDFDLSDVTIQDGDDDENMEEMISPKILTLPVKMQEKIIHNVSAGICEKGGLTYEHGEKLEIGCDQICTCKGGQMDCEDRCSGPFFRKGKRIDDPLCTEKPSEDPCCGVMVCAGDTETEPLEMCSFGNKTYNRGDSFEKDCSEVCVCEIAGNISCKARCPLPKKTSDRCVEIPDPSDPCCKKILCDVTLDDHQDHEKEEETTKTNMHKIISATQANASLIILNIEPKYEDDDENLPIVETSNDKKEWSYYQLFPKGELFVKELFKYVRLENTEDIIKVRQTNEGSRVSKDTSEETKKVVNNIPEHNSAGCNYKGKMFKDGDEYNDECESLCVCRKGQMKCLKLECPTYFGVDVLDPSCVEWETIPPNFKPSPPNCCPEQVRCKNNGSCLHEGVMYKNWDQLPINVTGCEKRCYCEMGKVECQNTCPLVPALPPADLPCPAREATLQNAPDDDCCKYWVCSGSKDQAKKVTNHTDFHLGPFGQEKLPSKVLGPLTVYANEDESNQIEPSRPHLSPEENPFVRPVATKNKTTVPQIFIHDHGQLNPKDQDDLMHILQHFPGLTNIPSGSVVEVHKQHPFVDLIPPELHPQPAEDISLKQILEELHKNVNPHGVVTRPFPNHDTDTSGSKHMNNTGQTQDTFNNHYPDDFGFSQPRDDISVHALEAVDPHTIRLAFMVPPVIVGLHGRVEVRYTFKDTDDVTSWDLQVFAPPNDLIATSSLEFDLLDLVPDKEYKIKITITLRDLHNTPSSRVYKIRTPKNIQTTTLPPQIPIEPDLEISDINATWVTVVWRKFTEYELQFIDGVQLRYREIDTKIYTATPLIHRAVTTYTIENLKPNIKYEIGIFFIPFPGQHTELNAEHMLQFTTANLVDTYGFSVSLEVSQIKSTSVEIAWNGVPYPEDKYVNIYRAIYQSDSGKEDHSTFKIAKRDSPTKTIITDLKPGTRYRLWLEVYLTNGKIKTSNVQDFITKPRAAPALGSSSQDKILSGQLADGPRGDYYGPLVIVAILAAIAILSTLILLLILVRRHNQNKAAITPPSTRISQSAYDNPTYKVEIQQETMGL